jgi:hypothetical protein
VAGKRFVAVSEDPALLRAMMEGAVAGREWVGAEVAVWVGKGGRCEFALAGLAATSSL